MTRFILTVSIAVLGSFVASAAHADARVTVHDFYGPSADRMRDAVVNLLERQSGVTIVSKGQVEKAAADLGVDPYSPKGRVAIGRELALSAWMTGVVQRRSGKLELTVVVFDGAEHTRLGRARLSGRTVSQLRTQIVRRLWRRSRAAIFRAAKQPEVAPDTASAASSAPASEPQRGELELARRADAIEPADDAGEDPASEVRRSEWLRAFLGVGSPYRSLAFSSPITPSLGDYQLSGAPMLDLNLVLHPAGLLTAGWVSWLGLEVRGQLALATPTVDRKGNEFTSSYAAYHLGLRARVPLGLHAVSAFAGYAMNRLAVTTEDEAVPAPTPSVDYRMIRSGAGAELALSDSFRVGVEGALLRFLEVGDIARWFPRASAGGFEVGLSVTYQLTPGVFGRAAASYQRTSFDFNPRPDDRYAAAGATDEYLAASIGAGIGL